MESNTSSGSPSRKAVIVAMAFGAAVGFGAIATAATTKSKTTTAQATAAGHSFRHGPMAGRGNETPLTGETATKAKAAAEAAVSGGTAMFATTEDPAEKTGAAYEVHVRKSDGTGVKVLLDSDFKVVAKQTDQGPGGPGGPGGRHGGPHGNPDETPLTGETATKAKAAAEAAVSGGTAMFATTEDPAEKTGAAYEVHVRKSDGTGVKVLLDSDFKVVAKQTDQGPGHGPGGPRGPHGPGGPDGARR